MICPKCGRPVAENAVICRGCDFILDTQFLGADILDEEHQLRPGQGGIDPAAFNLADAVILGNIGDDLSSFETSDSGFHLNVEQQAARLYVSGRSQAVMSPDAVIAIIDAGEKVRLTPFEKHVLRFIDGHRPVEMIRKQAGLDEAEVKTALATLADKGVVKVVGRALADAVLAGDSDVDTAPGVGARKTPRRVRGTLVGAVVVVGDEADQAIDDAFRTRVRADAPRLDGLKGPVDGDDVFSMSEEHPASLESNDIESVERPTNDDPLRRRPPSVSVAVRPGAQRAAVNTARGSGQFAGADVADASDGFDEFGDASNIATAVVQQPSLSDESLPPAQPQRPSTNARRAPLSELPDLDDLDAPLGGEIADSRVVVRPVIPGVTSSAALAGPAAAALRPDSRPDSRPDPRAGPGPTSRPPVAAPAPVPSSLGGSESLNDVERAAMSGGVWDEQRAEQFVPQPAARPVAGTNVGARKDLSTSLSELLSDSEEELEPTAAGVELGRRPADPRAAGPRPADRPDAPGAGLDSGFEGVTTAAVPLTIARPVAANVAASAAARSANRVLPRASASNAGTPPPRDAAGHGGHEALGGQARRGDSGAASAVSSPAAASPARGIPGRGPSAASARDDDNLFDDDEFLESTGGAAVSQMSTGSVRRGEPALPGLDDESIEATVPPSLAPSRDAAPGSVESLDSAMVVRPTARPGRGAGGRPGMLAGGLAGGIAGGLAAGAPRAADPPAADPDDDDDFMVDPDATQNLPARPKSMESRRRRSLPAESVPTAAPVLSEPVGRAPRAPANDMRPKARQLFERALEEHAAGKLGAARMNLKLATLYDPDVSEYQRVLDDWEDRPRNDENSTARPEYVELYEQAQDLEDDGDIEGALDALERGRQLAPEANAAVFHNRIGVILAMRKREFDRAAAEIERAIALDPGNAHYRNNLGKVMARAHRRRGLAANSR